MKRKNSINAKSYYLNSYVDCSEVITKDSLPDEYTIKEEIKEKVKESDEEQGAKDSNLDTDNLVDCSQYVQVCTHEPFKVKFLKIISLGKNSWILTRLLAGHLATFSFFWPKARDIKTF